MHDTDQPESTHASSDRRPLAVRNTAWARRLARALGARAITPNQISVLSMVFALIGALALLGFADSAGLWTLPIAAICIQLRLLCNLLDGMVAVEGGKASATGGLYNEVPDRVADSLLLVAAGYAAHWAWLGWLAALLAVQTAYIRCLVASMGLPHDFSGPMAKQHRMAVLTVACLLATVEAWHWSSSYCLQAALALIAIGCVWTCIRRLRSASVRLHAAERAAPAQK
jgi:phosphatidylglycerophosphate synthase